jgi:CPA1 family monovalent cation:H+ antiporter
VKGSYPILLVIAGILVSFVPGVPWIGFEPDLVFAVFLPPLPYSAAWTLSWREFQRHFVRIAMLAIGLVPFTGVGLAMAAGSLLPGVDWRSTEVLGAAVGATDAIAATSIARRVGLPQRIVDDAGHRTHTIRHRRHRTINFLTGGGVLIGLEIEGRLTMRSCARCNESSI